MLFFFVVIELHLFRRAVVEFCIFSCTTEVFLRNVVGNLLGGRLYWLDPSLG